MSRVNKALQYKITSTTYMSTTYKCNRFKKVYYDKSALTFIPCFHAHVAPVEDLLVRPTDLPKVTTLDIPFLIFNESTFVVKPCNYQRICISIRKISIIIG